MKKILLIATIACASLMVSCTSKVEKKAQEFVKRSYEAGLVGDYEAIERIAIEEAMYVNTLTPEEQAEYTKACFEAGADLMK